MRAAEQWGRAAVPLVRGMLLEPQHAHQHLIGHHAFPVMQFLGRSPSFDHVEVVTSPSAGYHHMPRIGAFQSGVGFASPHYYVQQPNPRAELLHDVSMSIGRANILFDMSKGDPTQRPSLYRALKAVGDQCASAQPPVTLNEVVHYCRGSQRDYYAQNAPRKFLQEADALGFVAHGELDMWRVNYAADYHDPGRVSPRRQPDVASASPLRRIPSYSDEPLPPPPAQPWGGSSPTARPHVPVAVSDRYRGRLQEPTSPPHGVPPVQLEVHTSPPRHARRSPTRRLDPEHLSQQEQQELFRLWDVHRQSPSPTSSRPVHRDDFLTSGEIEALRRGPESPARPSTLARLSVPADVLLGASSRPPVIAPEPHVGTDALQRGDASPSRPSTIVRLNVPAPARVPESSVETVAVRPRVEAPTPEVLEKVQQGIDQLSWMAERERKDQTFPAQKLKDFQETLRALPDLRSPAFQGNELCASFVAMLDEREARGYGVRARNGQPLNLAQSIRHVEREEHLVNTVGAVLSHDVTFDGDALDTLVQKVKGAAEPLDRHSITDADIDQTLDVVKAFTRQFFDLGHAGYTQPVIDRILKTQFSSRLPEDFMNDFCLGDAPRHNPMAPSGFYTSYQGLFDDQVLHDSRFITAGVERLPKSVYRELLSTRALDEHFDTYKEEVRQAREAHQAEQQTVVAAEVRPSSADSHVSVFERVNSQASAPPPPSGYDFNQYQQAQLVQEEQPVNLPGPPPAFVPGREPQGYNASRPSSSESAVGDEFSRVPSAPPAELAPPVEEGRHGRPSSAESGHSDPQRAESSYRFPSSPPPAVVPGHDSQAVQGGYVGRVQSEDQRAASGGFADRVQQQERPHAQQHEHDGPLLGPPRRDAHAAEGRGGWRERHPRMAQRFDRVVAAFGIA